MPPKNVPPPDPDADIPEETEETEDTTSFRLSVASVSNLPCPLDTSVLFAGICKSNRTSVVAESENPEGYELAKDKFIRKTDQDLFDDIVSKTLDVTLCDAAAENAVIGTTKLSLLPLLHDQTEIEMEVELTLTEAYHIKWWPDKEAELAEAAGKDKKGAPKAKAKAKAQEEPQEIIKRPEGFVPPPTVLRFAVRVDQLVGPAEDREDWTTFQWKMSGAFSLPERLLTVGLANPATDDPSLQPIRYKTIFLGTTMDAGCVAKPAEEKPTGGAGGGDEGETAEAEVTPEESAERYSPSIQFKTNQPLRYRGSSFLKQFRTMLNVAGGLWVYFLPEEIPSPDPKKPNPPEVGALTKHFAGKAWLDLRSFLHPGERLINDRRCPLRSAAATQEIVPDEATLEAANAYVKVSFELRLAPVAPPDPPVEDLRDLVYARPAYGKFPASEDPVEMYREAVQELLVTLARDCTGTSGANVASALQQLKASGSYEDIQELLRGAVLRVFRERMRKCTTAIPEKPLKGPQRSEWLAKAFAHLKGLAGPAPEVVAAPSDVPNRNARLALEAEISGNWDRAATRLQSRLLLAEVRCKPSEWIAYGKFCARCEGRRAAAEEALKQAVALIASGEAPDSQEDNQEVDMMLACLMLDRGRTDEAIAVFKEWHQKEPKEPLFAFLLGLGVFLADEEPAYAQRLLKSISSSRSDVSAYCDCLEKLLDYSQAGLVFTFLDQCKVIPKDVLDTDARLILIDARASIVERDYEAAAKRAARITTDLAAQADPLMVEAAWTLQGQCHHQLGDMERAIQCLESALAVGRKITDPAFYIRLGTVLVSERRWPQAREAYLKSIQLLPTAEAWSGVGYAEYRSDELQMCYEALREANLLDGERSDVWTMLALFHLRTECWEQATHCFQQCVRLKADCAELLCELGTEFAKASSARGDRDFAAFAAVAARAALDVTDTAAGHAAMAEAHAAQGSIEQATQEAMLAMEAHRDEDARKAIYERAVQWCEDNHKQELAEALHDLYQRLIDDEAAAP
mmetsp:Transcript_7316/g.16568  ORF Transcript_7316/g.16568 Transcript_7316/m.16568 type:complete len:1027 (-) Transcript_7316:45-3125(-)|eukprot:CAMPEP_0206435688 /NCGR_PEP_ID=MMETSP0324_2-20121206/10026_1 /ASSEMBLY_ACC=CAM_ASM_000836 /TAXON_ID=2866 /ORGANISM="Crypthecodinium cohnii, Strain Seligo" /LENGTH=1026 /DNA_ID=CAMNT_0053902689 /DNA_START=70 /DNA_END=3150 /DNA_ORIENTATION=-